MTPEKTVQVAIVAALEARGYEVIRQNSGTGRGHRMRIGEKGISDLLVLGPRGRASWVEVKAPGRLVPRSGEQERYEDQRQFHDRMTAVGCRAGFADSVDGALEIVEGGR